MGYTRGRAIEIRLEPGGQMKACIACPTVAVPKAGQYLLASNGDDVGAPLGIPLFIAEGCINGFWTAPPIPNTWNPGTNLDLVGPLGHAFTLPRDVRRLGLAAMGDTALRLMPLAEGASRAQRSLTLFTDLPLPALPASVEAYPIASLAEALDWPDFMAIDLPLQRLGELRGMFGLKDGSRLPFPAQVLITVPMPCAGLAGCGACAVPGRRGWKLACEDGPVFDLDSLKW
jgi:hypothetical protein